MRTTRFEFCNDCPLQCQSCAHTLRRALEQISGIEEISISVRHQRISLGFNPVCIDADAIGEKLADLGYVVRPCS